LADTDFPSGYWPEGLKLLSSKQWKNTIQGIAVDLDEMIALVRDPVNDLFAPFPWGNGQNLFREAMVLGRAQLLSHRPAHSHQTAVGGSGERLVGFKKR